MPFLITKTDSLSTGKQILLYPPREGDEIFEFSTLQEAESKLNEIIGWPIYSDCTLEIIEDEYGFGSYLG
jgi:hypothetical protein